MPSLPPALLENFHSKRNIVPFVGAGVSMAVHNRKGDRVFPSWGELLKRGAQAIRQLGDDRYAKYIEDSVDLQEDPLEIADKLAKKLKGGRWPVFLRDQFDIDRNVVDDASLKLPNAIWELANKLIITTNYDKVLHWSSPDKDNTQSLHWDSYSELARLLKDGSERPKIWYLHGCIDKAGDLILTSESFEKLYDIEMEDHSKYRAAILGLQNLFIAHTIFFVGFSFADPFVGRHLEKIAAAFDNKGEEHFGLFCEREKKNVEPLLEKLQVTPIYYEDYGSPMLEVIDQLTQCRQGIKESLTLSGTQNFKDIVSPNSQPPYYFPEEPLSTYSVVRNLDILGPTYILDKNFYFLDWNPAFEFVFAKPLGLRLLTSNATDFIAKFRNRSEVEERAKIVFPAGQEGPLVDIEPIYFMSDRFGLIEVKKIAARINDAEGKDAEGKPVWSVTLNLIGAEHKDKLWEELQRVIQSRVNWSLYAANYDALVLDFPPYQKLLEDVCGMLAGINNCVDLGAGTGNGTLKLLALDPRRFVCAIEPNDEMLVRFKRKAEIFSGKVDYVNHSLELLHDVGDSSFDGGIMINVLYALDDPAIALKEIARILVPGGVLALSTPHRDTDVDALFKKIKTYYIDQGCYQQKQAIIKEARNRHEKMLEHIHRDSKDDIRRYLTEAGFDIAEWRDDEYEGAVVVVKAVKRR